MNTQPQVPYLAEIKERQQRAWASGDYSVLGAAFVIISELLCEAVDLRPGQRVLDVATGTGDLAIELSRRVVPGGEVVGTDFADRMLRTVSTSKPAQSRCSCRSELTQPALNP